MSGPRNKEQTTAIVVSADVITKRYYFVMALQEVEVRREAPIIYMQALRVGWAPRGPFSDAVIAKKYYALAMIPGRKSGHAEGVYKGKEMLLHRMAPCGRASNPGNRSLRQSSNPSSPLRRWARRLSYAFSFYFSHSGEARLLQ